MQVADLGTLDGPVLLFGGPYSNLQATAALIDHAGHLGIPPQHVICTGDVVAYCGDPAATTARIRTWGCHVIAGNCEQQLASGAQDCGCGFTQGSACDLLSGAWYTYATQQIDSEDKEWMGSVPDIATFTHHGARYGVLHGGVRDVAAFIWSTTPQEELLAQWDQFERAAGPVDHLIAGHCGMAFMRDTPRGCWINAGVIGMPPHNGAPQTRFAILEGGDVKIHRLDYDAQAAADAMQRAGLPDGYRRGLTMGYWPSEDVLPPELRLPDLESG